MQWISAASLAGLLLFDVLGPRIYAGERYAAPAPFLAQAAGAHGSIGRPLPDTMFTRGSRSVPARDLRPAVLMLVPRECGCTEAMRQVVAQADGSGIRVYVVGAGDRRQVNRIAAEARGDVVPLLDEAAMLQTTYATGLSATLLLVRRDGIVVEIIDTVDRDLPLRDRLPALLMSA